MINVKENMLYQTREIEKFIALITISNSSAKNIV